MSSELHALLKSRAQISALRWPSGLAASFGLHIAVVAGFVFWPDSAPKDPPEKIRWVTLPAASGGVSGGSAPTEEGQARGRQRRVEEVAPASQAPPRSTQAPPVPPKPAETPPARQEPKPDPRQTELRPPAQNTARPPSGTNTDTSSRGTASAAARGESPAKTVVPGAAGSGATGGVGQGSGIPGLRPTKGIMGGTGILQEFVGVSDFPLWYAQQIQDNVTRNWNQLRGREGRVQIYFRIARDGKIEAARVEISSDKPELDDMALQAVRRAKLPPLPEEFEGSALGVRFWFHYGS